MPPVADRSGCWTDAPAGAPAPPGTSRSAPTRASGSRRPRRSAGPGSAGDGSLGGVDAPARHLALDPDGTLHLLDRAALRVRRFDPAMGRFPALPSVGGRGRSRASSATRPHRHRRPPAVRRRRRQPPSAGVRPHQPRPAAPLRPLDLATRRRHRRRRRWPGSSMSGTAACAGTGWVRTSSELVARPPAPAPLAACGRRRRRQRLPGRLQRGVAAADVLRRRRPAAADRRRRRWRDRFGPPPIRRGQRGRFCLPAELTRACDRRPPATAPPPEAPAAAVPAGSRRPASSTVVAGRPRWRRARRPGRPATGPAAAGSARPLDSEDRTAASGTGSSWSSPTCRPVRSSSSRTYADDQQRAPDRDPAAARGPVGDAPHGRRPGPRAGQSDARPGRGIPRAEPRGPLPVVAAGAAGRRVRQPRPSRSMRVHYPRRTYLEYLPAVYSRATTTAAGSWSGSCRSSRPSGRPSRTRSTGWSGYFDPDAVPRRAAP